MVLAPRCRVREPVGYFAGTSQPSKRRDEWAREGASDPWRKPRFDRSMTLLLVAVASMVVALIETTVTPYLRVGESQPHLVFVFAVIITVAAGFERGLVWGFVGGLVLDVLAQRPLGSSAFALLLVVGGAAVLGRLFFRVRPLTPIIATFLLSFVYTMTLFVTFGALRGPLPVDDFTGLLVPGAVYDTVVAGVFGPLIVAMIDRRAASERVEW